jgi:hypothetical protein
VSASVPLAAAVGENSSGSWHPLPVLTTAQDNVGAVLLQPAGNPAVASVNAVAALPSSVVKLTATGCLAPTAASISPTGDAEATTLFAAAAA